MIPPAKPSPPAWVRRHIWGDYKPEDTMLSGDCVEMVKGLMDFVYPDRNWYWPGWTVVAEGRAVLARCGIKRL